SFSGWVVYIAAFLLLFAFGWLLDRFNPSRRGGGGRGGGHASERVSEVEREANEAAGDERAVVGGRATTTAARVGGEGSAG
ncbi:MAG: hypothetical protein H7Z38_09715, partial [Rubrivivax sp.]|nr:hypothetical protein [Pyrinomonadaceae bacterium]